MRREPSWLIRLLTVFVALFFAIILIRTCKAADLPDTRTLMARVERILIDAGYAAKGYSNLEPPRVYFAAGPLPRNDWGWYVPGTILLSPDQPEGCIRITLAHELSHDLALRMRLIEGRNMPIWAIRDQFERIATTVEVEIEHDTGYAPNCLVRRAMS